MNFLPYFVYWLISRDLSNDLDFCTNKYSGDNGICLSEWFCTAIAKGVNVGSCNSRIPEDKCCKIVLPSNIGKLDISHLILANRVRSNLTKTWEMVGEALRKHRLNNEHSHNKGNLGTNLLEQKFQEIDNISNSDLTRSIIISKMGEKIRKTQDYPMPGELLALDFPLLLNPDTIHYVQKSDHIDTTHNMHKLIQLLPIHDLWEPLQVDPIHDLRSPVRVDPTHDLRGPVRVDPIHDLHSPVQVDPTHDPRSPVQVDLTHDLRKPVQIDSTQELRQPTQLKPTYDLQNPFQFPAHDLKKAVKPDSEHNRWTPGNLKEIIDLRRPAVKEFDQGHQKVFLEMNKMKNENQKPDFRKLFRRDTTHNLQTLEPAHDRLKSNHPQQKYNLWGIIFDDATQDLQKCAQTDPTREIRMSVLPGTNHDSEKCVYQERTLAIWKEFQFLQQLMLNITQYPMNPDNIQVDPIYDIRKSVQVHPIHDMRKPVQVNPKHNMRKPVQVDPTHNMRKPVQRDPTHDMRKPVQRDPTHNLRKPVKSMETHDLRWPVVEEPDHGFRNPIPEIDIFRSDDVDEKLKKIIQDYLKKGSKSEFVANEHDPVYQLLHEDEFLILQCTPDYLHENRSASSMKTSSRQKITAMKSEYNKIFNESLKACGIPLNKSTEQSTKKGSLKKWPWMVSLQEYILNQFWHKCTGTLLNNLWVITAAHCVESRPKWDFLIHLGVDHSEESRSYVERFVDRISIHPKFKNMDLDHDIALLRMESPVIFQPDILPICLPWKTDEEIENKKALALGWRLETERRVTQGSSRENAVPVLSNEECEVMFSETGSTESIQESFLCTRFQDRRQGSCIGDSGGPLTVLDNNGKWILAGLYSWGKTCSTDSRPEVYIKISRYADWIEYTIACYEKNINLHGMN